MPAVGDYIKTLTRRLVALHEASALTASLGMPAAARTFAQAVQPKERITRSRDSGDPWPQWLSGTRGAFERLEWDLMLLRMEAGRTPAAPTFGNTARTSPPTCPQLINKVLVFESLITSPNGKSDDVTALALLSEAILINAGNGLSPSGYDNLAWITGVGLLTARFADERLDPSSGQPQAVGPGRLVHRGRVEIPVAVSLVNTTDILGT